MLILFYCRGLSKTLTIALFLADPFFQILTEDSFSTSAWPFQRFDWSRYVLIGNKVNNVTRRSQNTLKEIFRNIAMWWQNYFLHFPKEKHSRVLWYCSSINHNDTWFDCIMIASTKQGVFLNLKLKKTFLLYISLHSFFNLILLLLKHIYAYIVPYLTIWTTKFSPTYRQVSREPME